ncbi:MAG: hypothetical protein ACKOTB_19150, partial [Planctomycetia bacterium]
MHANSRTVLASVVAFALLAADAAADPWIAAVTPRLVGRGGTCEIVINQWRHEVADVLFYPPATYAPWTPSDAAATAAGIRCVGTEFSPEKQRLVCRLEVAADCRPGEHPFRVLTAVGLSSMGTVFVSPFRVVDEGETKPNTNDTAATAVTVEPDVTVRGSLSNSAADDVDCFRVAGKAGERLSVEVDMVKMGDDLVWNP